MNFTELILLAAGLAMDAFAVSVCKGLAIRRDQTETSPGNRTPLKGALTAGMWFGGFQALMPVLGFLLGSGFIEIIESFDHWIAFGLLSLIGINMIRETIGEEDDAGSADLRFVAMLLLAVATSIDALAVGITFAVLHVPVIFSAVVIGCVTFVISGAGVFIGSWFGTRFKKPAQIAGGVILIGIGIRILLQHLL